MKIYSALLCVAWLMPSISHSQTLCGKKEIDYFSCGTTNGKVISICGNIVNGEITDESWVQYRFGKTGAIELTYPNKKQKSVDQFEGKYFNKYGVMDLRFINGKMAYSVDLNDMYVGEDAQERTQPSGGVSVEIGNARKVKIGCKTVNVRKYFVPFSELNGWLRAYNGDTDILYGFHKNIVK